MYSMTGPSICPCEDLSVVLKKPLSSGGLCISDFWRQSATVAPAPNTSTTFWPIILRLGIHSLPCLALALLDRLDHSGGWPALGFLDRNELARLGVSANFLCTSHDRSPPFSLQSVDTHKRYCLYLPIPSYSLPSETSIGGRCVRFVAWRLRMTALGAVLYLTRRG